MSVTKEFWDYFKPICESVEGVVYTQMSDGNRWERILESSRKEKTYPGVFALRPKYKLTDNGADQTLGWFDVTFFVFCYPEKVGSYPHEDAALDHAEEIAAEIYRKLRADDGRSILFDDGRPIHFEPVSWLLTDAAYGYEVKVKFALPVNAILYAS